MENKANLKEGDICRIIGRHMNKNSNNGDDIPFTSYTNGCDLAAGGFPLLEKL